MSASSPRALIIGGSLGGLFVANLLLRNSWDVHVFEQSSEALAGRGAGIIPHPELFECLRRIGIEIDDTFGVDNPERVTFDRSGAVVGTLPVRHLLTTWGRLHELVLGAFPSSRYHLGHSFQRLETAGDAIAVRFSNGARARADLVIGADGLRSSVREQLAPDARPQYAGYVGWRGLAEESVFSAAAHRDLFPRFAFCLPPREMMLGYAVAGLTNSTRSGERCYNFVWYRPTDASNGIRRLCTDTSGKVHELSIPPQLIRSEVLKEMRQAADELLAPQFAEVVRLTRQPFFQAIFDLASSRISFDRAALLGDAAFVARPHVGMGVTKAAGDAMALADFLRESDNDVGAALARYQAERAQLGSAVVNHARELGAWLQGIDTEQARRHHTPEAVMAEIAVTRSY
jgi:2-polyprenyl-6-methoxyphenol hydroxylase-like FAD-dependent oxidoreductase